MKKRLKARLSIAVIISFLIAYFPVGLNGSAKAYYQEPAYYHDSASLVSNSSFEDVSDNSAMGWTARSNGYRLDSGTRHGKGVYSVSMDSTDGAGEYGVTQTVYLNRTETLPFKVSGWSKAINVGGSPDNDYAIGVDIIYIDNTQLIGEVKGFNTGTHDWENVEFTIDPAKPVKSIVVYGLFRNKTGKAWFDDIAIEEYPANLLQNQSMEEGTESIEGWQGWDKGFTIANTEGLGNSRAARIENTSGVGEYGMSQTVFLNRDEIRPILIRGWSKAQDVSGAPDSGYSLYADIYYDDGTAAWGYFTPFDTGTHDWQNKLLYFKPEKPIKSISVYALFRYHTGTVWFDNLSVEELATAPDYSGTNIAFSVAPTLPSPEKLANGDFESTNGNQVANWNSYGKGYNVAPHEGRNGSKAVVLENSSKDEFSGLYTGIGFYQSAPRTIAVSGWSKAENVSGDVDGGYGLYMDIAFTDGTYQFAKTVSFSVGTHDWQNRTVYVNTAKPISAIYLYGYLNGHTGKVWYDDFSVKEVTDGAELQDMAVTPLAERPQTAYTTLETTDGLSLSLGQNGVASLKEDGVELKAPGVPSGFLISDQAAKSHIYAFERVANDNPNNYSGTVEDLGLKIDANFTAQPDGIKVSGRLSDMRKEDRAVTLSFALPIDASGWRWGDYIRQSREIGSSSTAYSYTNSEPPDFETGPMSLYPTSAIYNAALGKALSIGVDHSKPTHYKLEYNRGTKQLLITFEFGLASDTANFPNSADFSFMIYRFDADWGFRGAFDKYMRLFPEAYNVRLPEQGIWMPFAPISKVPNWQDFGFKFKEGHDDLEETAFSIRNDIKVFSYTELGTWWQHIDQSLPQTIATAISERDKAASEGFLPARMAQVAAMKNADGNPMLQMILAPWTKGARWFVNANPDLPGNPNAYSLYYSDDILAARYSGETQPDGEYLDTLDGWPYTLNFERNHFPYATAPLAFSKLTGKPALHRAFSVWEAAKRISDRMHGMGKFMMANGTPYAYSMYMPMLDVMGNERQWLASDGSYLPDPDDVLSRYRTLAGQKPYLMLQNSDFNIFTHAYMEKYMQRTLFYGIYPSAFSSNASDESNYWKNASFYERDRDLFKKYIPIIKRVAEAGWQPMTYATSSNAVVYVERYGEGNSVYLTVMNDKTNTSNSATITLDPARIGLTGQLAAVELISGEEIAISDNRFSVDLAPGQSIAVHITGTAPGEIVPVKQLSLTPASIDLYPEESVQLNAAVSPLNATNKSLIWSSSNTKIAEVNQNGIVTARKKGEATITAATVDGSNIRATTAVTVKDDKGDAALSELIVTGGNENLIFDSNNTEYLVRMDPAKDTLTIKPTSRSKKASIKVNGIELKKGQYVTAKMPMDKSRIEIVTTSQDGGSTKTYILTVIRARNLALDAAKITAISTEHGNDTDANDYNYEGEHLPAKMIDGKYDTYFQSNEVTYLNAKGEFEPPHKIILKWSTPQDFDKVVLVVNEARKQGLTILDMSTTTNGIDWPETVSGIRGRWKTNSPDIYEKLTIDASNHKGITGMYLLIWAANLKDARYAVSELEVYREKDSDQPVAITVRR